MGFRGLVNTTDGSAREIYTPPSEWAEPNLRDMQTNELGLAIGALVKRMGGRLMKRFEHGKGIVWSVEDDPGMYLDAYNEASRPFS